MTDIITTSSPVIIDRQQSATWEDYLYRVKNPQHELERVFFDCGSLWIEDLGNEGINHARSCKLITMILASWFVKQGKSKFDLLGGCGIEKQLLDRTLDRMDNHNGNAAMWTQANIVATSSISM